MNQYVTGSIIKQLRESRRLTQADLACRLNVSDKTVSKWETGKGYPDITLLEPIARELGVSVAELISGNAVHNANVSANMLRGSFYACPVCGNVLHGTGEASVSCHGITLQPLEAETPDARHEPTVERVEDEHLVTINHPMTKDHYVSFIAALTCDRLQMVKLYPESSAQARFKICGATQLFWYCNRDGLFKQVIR